MAVGLVVAHAQRVAPQYPCSEAVGVGCAVPTLLPGAALLLSLGGVGGASAALHEGRAAGGGADLQGSGHSSPRDAYSPHDGGLWAQCTSLRIKRDSRVVARQATSAGVRRSADSASARTSPTR